MQKSESRYIITRRQFIGKATLAAAAVALGTACNNSKWQIGIYTRPWSKVDYRTAFDSIAEAGYEYVGLMSHKDGRIISQDTTIEDSVKVYEEARTRGLNIISVSGHSYDRNKTHEENIAGLKKLIDNSVACHCPNLMLNGISEFEHADNYYRMIAECGDYAAANNIMINLKPHGGTNASGADCRKRIENAGHKNFTLWYDPGNIYYYSNGEINPVDDVADVADIITGMCVKDFRMPRDVNVTPGTGMVDFPALFSRLKEGGFKRGPLVVECLNTGENDFLIAEARKTREFLEELIA